VVYPYRHISDAELNDPMLSKISPEPDARIREISKEVARRAGLSDDDIKKLYGWPVVQRSRCSSIHHQINGASEVPPRCLT
jgi:hypothetical protein